MGAIAITPTLKGVPTAAFESRFDGIVGPLLVHGPPAGPIGIVVVGLVRPLLVTKTGTLQPETPFGDKEVELVNGHAASGAARVAHLSRLPTDPHLDG